MIGRIRALARKAPVKVDQLDINEAIREVIALTRGEIKDNRIALGTQLAEVAPIRGDRVQLQQVILNLILNAIEAMGDNEPREPADRDPGERRTEYSRLGVRFGLRP